MNFLITPRNLLLFLIKPLKINLKIKSQKKGVSVIIVTDVFYNYLYYDYTLFSILDASSDIDYYTAN